MALKVIGPYRVLETLGVGGVGTVYRAVDRRTDEEVALKLLATGPALDPRAARRLAREFETLANLAHPNVVKVFDTGVFQGYPYLAMELVEGLTLRNYLTLVRDGGSGSNGSGSGSGSSNGEPRILAARAGPLSTSHGSSGVRSPPPVFDPSSEPAFNGSAALLLEEDPTASSSVDVSVPTFNLESYQNETPSEDSSLRSHGSNAALRTGPDSLRALAAMADEPDTEGSHEGQPTEDVYVQASLPPRQRPPNLEEINRPERVGRLKDVMLQLCQALAYIHGHGVVHRDLKPSNVMVDQDGQVRLMDFGLAKFLADDVGLTGDGRMVGTFRYMAPEQILSEPLDGRADLYSLGVILYELLSGRPPFDARTPYELWEKVLETEPPSLLVLNHRGDTQLARVAHRLIRKEPDDRFQTAEEVYEALSE